MKSFCLVPEPFGSGSFDQQAVERTSYFLLLCILFWVVFIASNRTLLLYPNALQLGFLNQADWCSLRDRPPLVEERVMMSSGKLTSLHGSCCCIASSPDMLPWWHGQWDQYRLPKSCHSGVPSKWAPGLGVPLGVSFFVTLLLGTNA